MVEHSFDDLAERFIPYYGTVRGRVREQLTRENLAGYSGDSPKNVLDVGGGDGRDSIWLAGQGHRVLLIDPSQKMTEKAEEKVNDSGLTDRITITTGNPEDILAGVKAEYDLVLSHGVMMYLTKPQKHLNLLGQVGKPLGIVSILTKGKHGSMFRLLHEHRTSEAEELARSSRMVNNLDQDILAADESSMRSMLQIAQLSIEQIFGVRIATEYDYRTVEGVDKDELESILRLEAGLGSNESTRGLGQMMHYICKPERKQ